MTKDKEKIKKIIIKRIEKDLNDGCNRMYTLYFSKKNVNLCIYFDIDGLTLSKCLWVYLTDIDIENTPTDNYEKLYNKYRRKFKNDIITLHGTFLDCKDKLDINPTGCYDEIGISYDSLELKDNEKIIQKTKNKKIRDENWDKYLKIHKKEIISFFNPILKVIDNSDKIESFCHQ